MPPTTKTETIDALAWYPIVLESNCNRFRAREDAGGASQTILVRAPLVTSDVVTYPPGDEIKLGGGFRAATIGYWQTGAGQIDVAWIEEEQWE